jgi:hypothetical protein
MGDNTKEAGITTKCMEKESSRGLTARPIQEAMSVIKKKVLVSSTGLRAVDMKEIGKMASSMAEDDILMNKDLQKKAIGIMARFYPGRQSLVKLSNLKDGENTI